MKMVYSGSRANPMWCGEAHRGADIYYSNKEEKHFDAVCRELEELGWEVEPMAENWCFVETGSREEYEYLMADWKKVKKQVAGSYKRGADRAVEPCQ